MSNFYLTGNDSHRPGDWALETLKTFLENALAQEPYLSQFQSVGGVGITTKHFEADQWMRSKKPFIFLSFDDGNHQRELWRTTKPGYYARGTRHVMVIILELVVAHSALPSLQPLRDAIGDIIDRNREVLRQIGLTEASFEPNPTRAAQSGLINPHDLGCVVYSL